MTLVYAEEREDAVHCWSRAERTRLGERAWVKVSMSLAIEVRGPLRGTVMTTSQVK